MDFKRLDAATTKALAITKTRMAAADPANIINVQMGQYSYERRVGIVARYKRNNFTYTTI